MKKKYRLITLIIVILLIFIMIFTRKKGFNLEYVIDSKYSVKEAYNGEYLISIQIDDSIFDFNVKNYFNKKKNIIKDIVYYNDGIDECILPIFENDKILFDFICKSDNRQYYYYEIVGKNNNLDEYIADLNVKNYNINNFADSSISKKYNNLIIYTSNLIDGHYIGVIDYKGIYILNNKLKDKIKFIQIFDKDIYQIKLKTFIDNNYVVANYNSNYNFNEFYKVNLINGKISQLKTVKKISFDSKIQGIVDSKIYLVDYDSKKQYSINKNSINEIGNINKKYKYYENGKWNLYDYNTIKSKGQFSYNYSYNYEKELDYYNIYKDNFYLFTTTNINSVVEVSDYFYYLNKDCIYYFNHSVGKRKVYCNSEFLFNNNLTFGIYEKAK